jgi:hypothetical protein
MSRQYQVVFMVRDVEEVVSSQSSMLERLGRSSAQAPAESLKRHFSKHLADTKEWLGQQGNMRVLYINHRDAVMHTAREAGRLNEFLGGRLDMGKMTAMIDQSLYRERKS